MKSNDGLLVVSFGTSYEETRKCTLEAIERDLQAAFPDRVFFRAWTSRRIIKKLRETQGLHYDTVAEALEKMLAAGIENLLVQPTHMPGGGGICRLGRNPSAPIGPGFKPWPVGPLSLERQRT